MANLALKETDDLGTGLLRVVAAHHRHLEQCLAAEGDALAEAIHDARTTCKKLRAIHRVVGPAMGRKKARRADLFYRDLARQLSEARDAQVMLQTLGSIGPGAEFPEARRVLAERAAQAMQSESHLVGVMAAARVALAHFGERAPFPLLADEFSTIERGLLEIYAEGHALFEAAHRDPKPSLMHEWRKRAKEMLHATQLLNPLWPAEFRAHAKEWKRLTDLLGEEHDATVLIKASSALGIAKAEGRELKARLNGRREDLRALCWPLALRLYAEPVHAWRDRIEVMWGAWKSERVVLPPLFSGE